jgi:hypothetical protein
MIATLSPRGRKDVSCESNRRTAVTSKICRVRIGSKELEPLTNSAIVKDCVQKRMENPHRWSLTAPLEKKVVLTL